MDSDIRGEVESLTPEERDAAEREADAFDADQAAPAAKMATAEELGANRCASISGDVRCVYPVGHDRIGIPGEQNEPMDHADPYAGAWWNDDAAHCSAMFGGSGLACNLAAGHDGEHEHRGGEDTVKWSDVKPGNPRSRTVRFSGLDAAAQRLVSETLGEALFGLECGECDACKARAAARQQETQARAAHERYGRPRLRMIYLPTVNGVVIGSAVAPFVLVVDRVGVHDEEIAATVEAFWTQHGAVMGAKRTIVYPTEIEIPDVDEL